MASFPSGIDTLTHLFYPFNNHDELWASSPKRYNFNKPIILIIPNNIPCNAHES